MHFRPFSRRLSACASSISRRNLRKTDFTTKEVSMKLTGLLIAAVFCATSMSVRADGPGVPHVESKYDAATLDKVENSPPAGFVALFNGKDLTNWKGLL